MTVYTKFFTLPAGLAFISAKVVSVRAEWPFPRVASNSPHVMRHFPRAVEVSPLLKVSST